MKVILKENKEHLGFKDEVIEVKNGYARNFLIPQGIASLATPSAIKMLEENLRQSAVKNKKIQDEAQKIADALNEMVVKVMVKSGGKGKIFGSVTTAQLADAIKKAGYEVDKKYIKINGGAIKDVGSYEATARLHKDVSAVVKFDVIDDGTGKKAKAKAKPATKTAPVKKEAPVVEEELTETVKAEVVEKSTETEVKVEAKDASTEEPETEE